MQGIANIKQAKAVNTDIGINQQQGSYFFMGQREIINIIGAGLAGSEAALYCSKQGYRVRLIDCKPKKLTEAHTNVDFGELVCSNSLKSDLAGTASGLIKDELRMMGSSLIAIADTVRVAAGSALAVDRQLFAAKITKSLCSDPNITIVCEEAFDWQEDQPTIIATGPLTLEGLAGNLSEKLGGFLYFYDAAAPIVMADSLDYSCCFMSSRYNKGDADYLNCPLEKEEYRLFYNELINAQRVELRHFEDVKVFEGCMPVEIMASRGEDSLRFGPMRPVGLFHPESGKKYYAVLQLRRENAEGNMFNMVGFQTNLTFAEQRRVFGLIPALKDAEYARYGVMHRNSFVDAPKTLNSHFQTLRYPLTFIAGQLSGVEGYNESIASGLLAAINITRLLEARPMLTLPATTIMGALAKHISQPSDNFQPMNANLGLLPPPEVKIRDKSARKMYYHQKSISSLKDFLQQNNLC